MLVPILLVSITSGVSNAPITDKKLLKFFISVTTIILACEVSRWLIYKSREWAARSSGRLNRNILAIIPGVAFLTLVLGLSTITRRFISTGSWDLTREMDSMIYVNNDKVTFGIWTYALVNAVVNFFVLFVIYEVVYHYAKLRHTEKTKEILEQEKIKAELLQLKGIVNPHFLFNNLNSLSSLIAENPARAEVFLDELTKVFRYLLRNNEHDLTTLSNELKFIQSYYHLLQSRYGQGIEMDVQIDNSYEELYIPPMTLQLLVENAVKHNRLEKDNPLKISICSAPGNKLVVKNNISKRDTIIESTGIGLQNINTRYRILNHTELDIQKTGEYFSVVICLIG
jgi:two-component system, LytTR family, sensor kinase